MKKQPVSYLQTDHRWKGQDYSAKGEKTTVGASGCGPTAMAMVLATWADPAVTPATEAAWALKNGYKAPRQGTYYGYFVPAARRYGLVCRQLNYVNIYGNNGTIYHVQAKAAIDRGGLVIACMGKGNWTSGGHFVLVWKIEGDTIFINDPASTLARRTRGSYDLFKKQVKYYFVIEAPEQEPEEEDMTEEQTRKLIADALAEERTAMLVATSKLIREASPTVYNTEAEIPEWYREGYEYIKDVLQGKTNGLGLTEEMLRAFTLLARRDEKNVDIL